MRNVIIPRNRGFSGVYLMDLRDSLSLLAAVILTTKGSVQERHAELLTNPTVN